MQTGIRTKLPNCIGYMDNSIAILKCGKAEVTDSSQTSVVTVVIFAPKCNSSVLYLFKIIKVTSIILDFECVYGASLATYINIRWTLKLHSLIYLYIF